MKKILWITNVLIGHHREMMGLDNRISGGTWLHAAYAASVNNRDFQLHIATIDNVNETKVGSKDGNYFYILPGGDSQKYDENSEKHYMEWQSLKETVKPDLVLVWGTETRFAYLAMKAMKDVPKLVYMQGVINKIVEHYYEGLPVEYRLRTLRDIVDRINKSSQINAYKYQVTLESEMLRMAEGVIVENDWCEDYCRSINHNLAVFKNKLPIHQSFFSRSWTIDRVQPYTIFTNAGGYPIKGHHVLFKALGIIKQVYPDFKCYIPGTKLSIYDTIKRRTGYFSYLKHLIKAGDLYKNVVYVGGLSSEQMADYISKCNVYVMPSIVENHSSSLIEAMVVGAPCVSSLVGGVVDVISHGYNGLLYNSLDANSLAGIVIRLFESNELSQTLSNHCKEFRSTRENDFGKELTYIYKMI